jgi:phage terminase large subunit-like protein
MVLAIDASVNRDTTAIVGVTRHPTNRDQTVARLCKVWEPKGGNVIDFNEVEEYIKQICNRYQIVMLAYDSFQMEHMAQSLYRGGVVYTKRFSQQGPRTLADQFLYDSIMTGNIRHMGDLTLRKHIDNSDIQVDAEFRKKRIVKRSKGLKIDAAVALSMANYECKRLNI